MTIELADPPHLERESASETGWEMRGRVLEAIGRVERMLENKGLIRLGESCHWQVLAEDMEFGYRLLGYMEAGVDGGMEESGDRLPLSSPSLLAQCALFLADTARDIALAEVAMSASRQRRRRWRYAAWGGAVVTLGASLSSLLFLWWAFLSAPGAPKGGTEKLFDELGAHPLDAALYIGCGVALVHFAECHRSQSGVWHRLIAMLPVAMMCFVILVSLVFAGLQDMGYQLSESNLSFDLKCLGAGLGLTFLLRAYRKYRQARGSAAPSSAQPASSSGT